MRKKLVTNVGQLVTPLGGKFRSGSKMSDLSVSEEVTILIERGVVAGIGESSDFSGARDEAEIIDAGGKPVLPGFVDPHTHFVFSGYRAKEFQMRLQGKSYEEIAREGGGIASSVASTREASFSRLKKESRKRLKSMVRFGVTTVEGKTGYGLDKETELKQLKVMRELGADTPLDIVPTFLGAHSIPPKYSDRREEYVNFVTEEVMPGAAEREAEFCDVFCDQGAFTVEESRQILTEGKKVGLTPKIHADEIAGTGGAELSAEVDAISADHLLKASDEGLHLMKDRGVVAVLLPITAFSLKEDYARGRYMIDKGLPVSLATDFNPGSCFSESIPLLISLATLYMDMTVEETITALTLNAAAALDRADQIGSIERGKRADMIILDAPDYKHLSYHIGVNSVERVIKGGETIWKRPGPQF
ncbi:MAG: imidazolonepropionase [Candidatus Bipolaricaulota bacterium]|nr:imidazolonepropionase [Candidatus Bipolaricaulota bacterium]MBS3791089.1 imidazolonepropionase [Candidatus Bipolaricaulota bacterium]